MQIRHLCVLEYLSTAEGRRECPNLKAAVTKEFVEEGFTVLHTHSSFSIILIDTKHIILKEDERMIYNNLTLLYLKKIWTF